MIQNECFSGGSPLPVRHSQSMTVSRVCQHTVQAHASKCMRQKYLKPQMNTDEHGCCAAGRSAGEPLAARATSAAGNQRCPCRSRSGFSATQAAENSGRASSAAAQACTGSIGFLGRSNRETVLRVHLYCRRILAAFDNSRLRHRAGTPWPVRYVSDMDSPQRHKSTEKSCTGGHWAGRWPTQPPLWPASVAVMTIDLEFISDRVGVIAGGRVADAHA